MKIALLELFIKKIVDETGLQIRSQDRENLSHKILARMNILNIANPERYYQLLNSKTEAGREEWKNLIISLTTTETYFFRDRGQIDLLKNVVLPELISKKRLSKNKTLRLWSAGCSTGEEPYSLAILLRESIEDWQDWKIFILGTDVNEIVLEKAEKGIYSSWSFRQVDMRRQGRYFKQIKGEWKIDAEIRRMVTFCKNNLVKDDFQRNFDLIVCRNVFVYFKQELISLVIEKFYKALNPEGYLMTAHAELHGQNMDRFQVKIFPESLVYQKSLDRGEEKNITNKWLKDNKNYKVREEDKLRNSSKNKSSNIVLSNSAIDGGIISSENAPIATKKQGLIIPRIVGKEASPNVAPDSLLAEAETLFQNKKYILAIEKAKKAIESAPKNYDAYCLIAKVYANLGEYERAELFCKKALEVEPFSVAPYYLLTHIAEEKGEKERAKSLLKKIIYLCPSSISAYVELADIYESEGETIRARKMNKTALDLLKKLPGNTLVEYRGEIAASDFIKYLKQLLLKN
ncbi:MAG: CheR family methyltransferase [Cyanobacteriota bacterium]|nr:CheR family methyltransferase [Cyanobacteriota bacterium]